MEILIQQLSIIGSSQVSVDGKTLHVNHSRLLSRDGKRLQKCRIHDTSMTLSNDEAKAVRKALEDQAAIATEAYRNKNAQVAA